MLPKSAIIIGGRCWVMLALLSSCQTTPRQLPKQELLSVPKVNSQPRPLIKDPKAERWDVVTAKFRKVLRGAEGDSKYHKLQVIDPAWENIDLDWPEDTKLPLHEGRYYTFHIVTSPFYYPLPISGPNENWFNGSWITKVAYDGMTLFDESLCKVHGRKMIRKSVPIKYGDYENSYTGIPFSVWREQMPHGFECEFGGCLMSKNSPVTRRSWICSTCVQVAIKWRKANHVSEEYTGPSALIQF